MGDLGGGGRGRMARVCMYIVVVTPPSAVEPPFPPTDTDKIFL